MRRYFSLVELFVVIAIFLVLASLLTRSFDRLENISNRVNSRICFSYMYKVVIFFSYDNIGLIPQNSLVKTYEDFGFHRPIALKHYMHKLGYADKETILYNIKLPNVTRFYNELGGYSKAVHPFNIAINGWIGHEVYLRGLSYGSERRKKGATRFIELHSPASTIIFTRSTRPKNKKSRGWHSNIANPHGYHGRLTRELNNGHYNLFFTDGHYEYRYFLDIPRMGNSRENDLFWRGRLSY